MPLWVSIIMLGIIEGITEFLPVSSTGHLLIAQKWLPRQSDLFNILIQSGAVLAVLPLFPERLKQFAFEWRERKTQDYMLKIFVAFAITGVGGLILNALHFQLEEDVTPIAIALIVGGILFVALEAWLKGRSLSNEVTWTIVVAVGIAQLVAAIFPGASRSGTTIIAALILGLNRPAATEFTFLVGIPTMLAAGGLNLFKELRQGDQHEDMSMLLLGFVTSAVVSFIVVKWLLRYVQTHTFTIFGWYRIVIGVALVLLFWR